MGTRITLARPSPPGHAVEHLMRRARGVRLVLYAIAAGLSIASTAGCEHVAPYQRGLLAHPTMTVDDVSTGMEEHVRAVSEGASGGLSGGGGGCGCN